MQATQSTNFKYRWAAIGDLNAFFALMFDNVANLALFGALLTGIFKIPSEIVYLKMFPGTAIGVMIGDLIYTWMAFRLAKRTGNDKVTAMPLGLDSPSTVGIALMVIGPVFAAVLKDTPVPTKEQAYNAGIIAWQVGMATLFLIGMVKLVLSFFGEWVEKLVPAAGLLGSLAGVGITFLGLLPLEHMFGFPIVGMVAFGIILYALVAKIKLPFNIPSVFLSVVLGAAIYYIMISMKIIPGHALNLSVHFAKPVPTLEFIAGLKVAFNYLPIAIPFGLLTVIGGINVTASARLAGDSYKTRSILLTEAVATIGASLFGGVAQSTPYIGHPAYKAMGGRAAYTLATGIFIGLGGIFGYLGFMAELIPAAALAPIFIFVGLDIVEQSYHATPKRHATAVTMAILPAIPALVQMKLGPILGEIERFYASLKVTAAQSAVAMTQAFSIFDAHYQHGWLAINALGNGFILTAMIWGAFTAKLIDKQLVHAAAYISVGALFSLFGLMHSIQNGGGMYLPWSVSVNPNGPTAYAIPGAYFALALMLFLFSFTRGAKEAAAEIKA